MSDDTVPSNPDDQPLEPDELEALSGGHIDAPSYEPMAAVDGPEMRADEIK